MGERRVVKIKAVYEDVREKECFRRESLKKKSEVRIESWETNI